MQSGIASRRSQLIHIAFAVLGASLLVIGCEGKPKSDGKAQSKPQATVAVTTQPVRRDSVQRTVDVPGTLQGDEETTLSAKATGRIVAVFKDVGDRVQAGDVLAQIDKTDYQLQANQKELAMREALAKLGLTDFPGENFDLSQVPMVQRAKFQLENADSKLKRGEQLHDQKPPLLSDQDYADLKTAAAVALKNYDVELLNAHAALAEAKARKADLDLAKQQLVDTTILAPRQDGPGLPAAVAAAVPGNDLNERSYAIAQRMISVGTYVKDDTATFRLIDDDPVKLQAYVPERHVAEVQVGQKVRVTVEAYSQEFWGKVSRVNPQVDPANRTFLIEVVIPNSKRLLKPGGFAKASVHTQTDSNVVFAPLRAVVSFAGVSKVYVIRNGKAAEIIVETGQRRDDYVEITKGLTGKENVIVSGLNRVANGVPVVLSDKAVD
ncbi:MAG: efflux RND transporter periplasmic adaptor subunit [Bacillota bacterium]